MRDPFGINPAKEAYFKFHVSNITYFKISNINTSGRSYNIKVNL